MNRYNVGDILVSIFSFAHIKGGKEVGMIVEIIPSIKVKWLNNPIPQIIDGHSLTRYKVHHRKPNENRTSVNVPIVDS